MSHGFSFFMFCLFFENERRAGEMIFMIFCFVFLLFIASDGAAFLYLSVFTVSHFFFLMFCALVFDPGPF